MTHIPVRVGCLCDYPRSWNVISCDRVKYRPIKHTPIFYRIKECLTKYSLAAYLPECEPINTGKPGFLSKEFCATRMTDYPNAIIMDLSNETSVMVMLLDTTKAFDSVPQGAK